MHAYKRKLRPHPVMQMMAGRLSDEEIAANGWRVSGADLAGLTVSPGSGAVYSPSEGGYMRLSQQTPLEAEPPSIGVFGTMGPAHERVFGGTAVRVSFRARAVRDNALDAFQAAYVPVQGVASPWTEFDLTPDWRTYSFDFIPPGPDGEADVDLIAVFPGREGDNRQMDLAEIRVERIDP